MASNKPDWIRGAVAAALLAGALPHGALAQSGIYSCIDGKGRRITADRPIPECMDRGQKELNPSGTVRRTVGPSLTGAERAAREARAKQAADEQARLAEERRRDRALRIRYPSQAVHDAERAAALSKVEEGTRVAHKRLAELVAQRKDLDGELEFFRHDPTKVPHPLKRRVDENVQHQEAQKRLIDQQAAEKDRINARFDQELAKLRPMWPNAAPAGTPAREAVRAP